MKTKQTTKDSKTDPAEPGNKQQKITMSESITFKNVNLPTPEALCGALDNLQEEYGAAGTVIAKFAKGHWTIGKDMEPVDPGSTWAINPFSFIHGVVAFGGEGTPVEGELLGEKVAPMTDPKPAAGLAPEHATSGWQTQLGFSMKCMSGGNEGVEARFTSNSKGGVRSIAELIGHLSKQVQKDPTHGIPIVKLGAGSYPHRNPSYGRIYYPTFEIVDWLGKQAEALSLAARVVEAKIEVDEAEPEPESEPEPEQRERRRRRTAFR